MKKIIKIVAFALALVFMASAFAACENTGTVKNGKLVMATSTAFPPYAYIENDKIVGIDAEIAALIADKLSLKLEIKDVDLSTAISGIQTGEYDIGMAGMAVTSERLESVSFTTGYVKDIQVIIVKEGSVIRDAADLEGKMIGVQESTGGLTFCKDEYGEEYITAYITGADAIQALISDEVDCVVLDNEPAKALQAANEGLEILPTPYVEKDCAIAVSKDNPELLEKINTALSELRESGEIQKIVEKYIPAES